MVKFVAKGKDGSLVGLALTKENVERLKAGQPIVVKLGNIGIRPGEDGSKVEVLLMYGETIAAIRKELGDLIAPHTQLHIGGGALPDGDDHA